MAFSGLQSPLVHRKCRFYRNPCHYCHVVTVWSVYSCCLLLLLLACWLFAGSHHVLCYAFCSAVGNAVKVCLKLHLPVSSSVPCKVLSDCVIHSHFASGLPLLLSLVCASRGLLAGNAHHVLFQVLTDALFLCAAARHASMLPGLCSQQGRAAYYVPICFFPRAPVASIPRLSCAAAHLHQAGCSNLAAAKPLSISSLCACILTLGADCSCCCVRWMTSFV